MIRNIKALGMAVVAVLAFSAVAASGAQAELAIFHADAYKATISANGFEKQSFKTSEGTELTCVEAEGVPGVEGSATAEEDGATLTVGEIQWNNCHATVLQIPVTVDQNGCEFEFNAGRLVTDTSGTTATSGATDTSTGSVSIVGCESETKGITITVGENGKTCHIDVPEQEQVSGSVHYHTRSDGTNEYVESTVEKVVVNIDTTGGTACSGHTEESVPATATYNGKQKATWANHNVTVVKK